MLLLNFATVVKGATFETFFALASIVYTVDEAATGSSADTIVVAQLKSIAVLSTDKRLFEACGILYNAGLTGKA
jgi:hypothetical protein